MKTLFVTLCIGACICLSLTGLATAQTQMAASDKESLRVSKKKLTPSIQALRLRNESTFTFDGKLDDRIWRSAPTATGFTQREPHDGKPATEKTEAHIAYDDQYLFVGIKAYDSSKDSIAATLFRRDGSAYSDWVYVNIDSYNDNRTSFNFAVNPRGIRKDILTYNDTNEDIRWDAVWEAKTDIQDDGWSVEMKIPLSQIRFNTNHSVQTWGINFQRRIARKNEISFWSPTPQNASGLVSRYGNLTGIKNLENPDRLEIMPYASSSLTRAPGVSTDPFYNSNDFSGSIGADLKYGLTSDLTLTATINPDFGQVEADPATINLTAFETFFEEQRPFFLEGTDIFQFGRTETYNTFGNPLIFYSRRIGRQPQGQVSSAGIDANFVDSPDQTTIAGAAKVSGKTNSGLSIGLLNAFTTKENAVYIPSSGNQEENLTIEPPANYFVGRVKQDFNEGKTIFGGYASAVNRSIDAEYLKSDLHRSAYVAGLDFEHSWNDREWVLSGVLSGSQVNGSKEAITQTQTSSARYFNRIDAGYLSVDPARTSLSGYAGEFSFARYGGEHWRGSLTYSVVSPGYEVNDLGFENRADYHATSYLLMYRENSPAAPFRSYNFGLFANHAWNYGGERINNTYGFFSNIELTNLWNFHLNAGYGGSSYDDRLLRGGPLASSPTSHYYSGVISSDESQMISFSLGHFRGQNSSSEYERDVFMGLTIRPTSYIQINVRPSYNFEKDTDQYIQAVGDPLATATNNTRYVFSDIARKTLSTSFRLDWTFTPDISLQTYVRPFITSGDFTDYKEFTTPRKYEFAVYGKDRGTISIEDETYIVDPDGDGPADTFSFSEQDFNFRSIQTNAVFRWEYQPGATLYVVWQQDRSASILADNLNMRRDFSGLFDSEPTNVFLIKLSYWLGR